VISPQHSISCLDDRIDLSRSAVVRREIEGNFGAAAIILFVDGRRRSAYQSQSAARSLVVVPLEFSHCIEVRDAHPESGAKRAELIRVDGLLTGVLFEHDLDAVLAFRTGPLRNPTCRWQDYQELKEMLR